MSQPPNVLPRYRVLRGPDDASFCEEVSKVLDLGYQISGGPALAAGPDGVVVAQAISLAKCAELVSKCLTPLRW